MKRPRLTLGRLMAWIAFAGLNIAILVPFARNKVQTTGYLPLHHAAVWLGILYGLAYLAYIQVRDLAGILATPRSVRQKSAGLAVAALMLTLAFLLVLGLAFFGLRDYAGRSPRSW